MRKWFSLIWASGCILLSLTAKASASESVPLGKGLSFQGFTGILNTPNAQVTDEGWLTALYTNQKESKWRNRTPYQDNYLFSIGVFNCIELGGRLFDAPKIGRDLSGSLKLSSAVLTRDLPLVPVVAVGVQDAGGGSALLRTSYLVLSEEIWRLRLSAGYGRGPERMKGGFAGGEFKVMDGVYLLGDYDTKETNLGARAILPQFWKVPVRFTATAKTSLNYKPGNFDIAVGFSLPLDFRMRRPAAPETAAALAPDSLEPPVTVKTTVPLGPAVTVKTTLPGDAGREQVAGGQAPQVGGGQALSVGGGQAPAEPVPSAAPVTSGHRLELARLRDSLIGAGFVNVRVGSRERTLVVEYENTVFNHNELDALGLVAGLACQAVPPQDFETMQVVVKKRDLRTATISFPLQSMRVFLAGPSGSAYLSDQLRVDLDGRVGPAVDFLPGERNAGLFNTSLMLAPGLTTFVGTENGVFDYLLSLKPELTTMLWKGALASARWDIPVSWSSNLEDGRVYRSSRNPAQIDRLMLFQALQPLPSVMLNLGGGMVLHDRYGTLNEAVWYPGDGEHRFRLVQGWTEHGADHSQSNLLIGTYRYYFAPLDLSLEGAAGRFWSEDNGFSLELKRFWQDTAVSVFYKDAKGPDHKRWQSVGLQLSFPLTPRRDMKPVAKLQVRGSDEWAYAQETTLMSKNVNNKGGNFLAPYPVALDPQPAQSLNRSMFNRDRLSQAYLLQHLERLREAWLKYGTSALY